MDESTSVSCTKKIFVDLLLDEIFKRVAPIFAENASKGDDVLSLQTSFRSNFCNVFQLNIRVIVDGAAPSISESKYSQNLQDILEKETKEVVSKRKTYPEQIKKRLAQELVQERTELLSDVRLGHPKELDPVTNTQNDEPEVRQARSAVLSVLSSRKRLQALRREEEDLQAFVRLKNCACASKVHTKNSPSTLLKQLGDTSEW